jgi:hypothetical protein
MIALLCNLSEQDIWQLTAQIMRSCWTHLTFLCSRPGATERSLIRAIRFLGRRLHFPMTEYLDMPFSVFSDFLTDEVEAVNRGRTKPEP